MYFPMYFSVVSLLSHASTRLGRLPSCTSDWRGTCRWVLSQWHHCNNQEKCLSILLYGHHDGTDQVDLTLHCNLRPLEPRQSFLALITTPCQVWSCWTFACIACDLVKLCTKSERGGVIAISIFDIMTLNTCYVLRSALGKFSPSLTFHNSSVAKL